MVVLHDVTELRRLERVRQDFVANVSHEFKTPLTAIQGFAETLLGGALEDPKNNRRFLEIMRDHANRLARLTDDLLKLARIEAGKLELEFSPVGVIEFIERCAETALMKASRKQITLDIEIPPGLPPVRGDASLLRDVLQNLVDNAIQYTPPGGRIRVSARVNSNEMVIEVMDTGIGIPLIDQERIFERFLSRGRGPFPGSRRHRPGPIHRQTHHRRARRTSVGGKHSRRRLAILLFDSPG